MTVPIGSIVYLTSCVIRTKITAQTTMPDTPDVYGAELEIMDDRGAMDLSALVGKKGTDGQMQFRLRRQDELELSLPSQLPDDLDAADIGKYWVVTTRDEQGTLTEQWAYVWYGTEFRKTFMGSEGPPGPVPRIRPSVELSDPTTDSFVDTGGTTQAPSWRFNLAVPPGPVGASGALYGFPDYDNSPAPDEGMVLMCTEDLNDDDYPIWRPANVLALSPRAYSVPESAFSSHTGTFVTITSDEHVNVASFAIPPQPFDWTPVVWGHIGGTQRVLNGASGMDQSILAQVTAAIENFLDSVVNGTLLKPVEEALADIIAGITNAVGVNLSAFAGIFQAIASIADDLVAGVIDLTDDIFDPIVDVITRIVDAIGIRAPGASGATGGIGSSGSSGSSGASGATGATGGSGSSGASGVVAPNGYVDLPALVSGYVQDLQNGSLPTPIVDWLQDALQQVTNVTGIDLSLFGVLADQFVTISQQVVGGILGAGVGTVQTLADILGGLVGGVKELNINTLVSGFVASVLDGTLTDPVQDALTDIVAQVANLTGVDLSPFSNLVSQFLNISDDLLAGGVTAVVEIARALAAVVSQIVNGVVDLAAGLAGALGATGGGGWWAGWGSSGLVGASGEAPVSELSLGSLFGAQTGLPGIRMRIGARVLLGPQRKQIARGLGNLTGTVNIMPHYSLPARVTRNISPTNGHAVVKANHANPADGTIYVDLHNDGVFGSFSFNRLNSQLLVMVVPIDAFDTYSQPTTRRVTP